LWSLGTTPNRSSCLTSFFLVYGAEAILPNDVQYNSPRVEAYKEEDAEKSRQLSIDLLMHVKCIHDLCTLPLDIPIYLHHILVIFMLFDDNWEYFTSSLILLN
jgi:hypothetical protein